jgi:phosphate transport system protein
VLRTRHAFDEELAGLKQDLVKMGAFVESMLDRAVRALTEHDLNLARQVISDDDVADDLDLEIEQHCMRLLALQQPLSRDLRIIGTVLKIIADVERVGDYCVDIARAALTLGETAYFKPLVDIPRMAQIVADMLRTALQALVREDLDLVQAVVERDDEVDGMWYALLDELSRLMEQRPEVVRPAVQLLLVARYLERIADHLVNVVERVAYMVTGEVAHLAAERTLPPPPAGAAPA